VICKTTIADSIHENDIVFDSIIANYIEGNNIDCSVNEWRLDNYELLRRWAYPPQCDYLDAVAMVNSGDYILISTGLSGLRMYYQQCLDVKRRFSKRTPQAIGDFNKKEVQAILVNAIQAHMDSVIATRGYGEPDGRFALMSCCTYATSSNPKFSAEGQAAVEWRDGVWAKCYEVMADVMEGKRAIPTREELIAELPVFSWPS
jgi:hypothetical protein